MPPPLLLMQTNYAELLERCTVAAFDDQFPPGGTFVKKVVKGRSYWYFQMPASQGRGQKYVGPETAELSAQVARHRETRNDERERRTLVSALVRSFRLPRPKPEIGQALEALAKAGVFRLRSVIVGTIAYQTYPALLGITLPNPTLQTEDIDIAQFEDVSITVQDRIKPAIDILKSADATFRAVPTIHRNRVTSYVAKNGLRVEFLTPNKGKDTDSPKLLPALQTDAQPLRFLDFLIAEPEQAVVLHGPGILVQVPSPERYAVHKLIISRRRKETAVKRQKDVRQAEALLAALTKKRPHEVGQTWNEAFGRGPGWQRSLVEAMMEIAPSTRDTTLKLASRPRSILPGIDLTFDNRPGTYDVERDAVVFHGRALGHPVRCEISRAAFDDNFGTTKLDNQGRLKTFSSQRTTIETMARTKYLSWPIEDADAVLIRSQDAHRLKKEIA